MTEAEAKAIILRALIKVKCTTLEERADIVDAMEILDNSWRPDR